MVLVLGLLAALMLSVVTPVLGGRGGWGRGSTGWQGNGQWQQWQQSQNNGGYQSGFTGGPSPVVQNLSHQVWKLCRTY